MVFKRLYYMGKRISILVLIVCSFLQTKATHIVGGEINYRQLSNYNYEIKLILIRDCINGIPPFDAKADLEIFDSNLVKVRTVKIPFPGSTQIPNIYPGECIYPDHDICYEIAVYTDTVLLPPIAGGYQLVYQTCCRNRSIANIMGIGHHATYFASIPDTSIAKVNNNPIFNARTPTFVCAGNLLSFDHSAIDPDGDSLVYELYNPRSNLVRRALYPPFALVPWSGNHTLNNMLGSSPPLTVDPVNGLLTATPINSGQFLIGVKVKEYRNGVFLGQTSRDYELNITLCGKATLASFSQPDFSCRNTSTEFVNKSTGRISGYSWDFGDIASQNDTSSNINPSYTYNDTGLYSATLIVYSSVKSTCNDTTSRVVKIVPEYTHQVNYINLACSEDYRIVEYQSNSTLDNLYSIEYNWDFGDGVRFVNEKNPIHYYLDSGIYQVKLISYTTENMSCSDTSELDVKILPEITSSSIVHELPCTSQVSYIGSVNYDNILPVSYLWDFGDLDEVIDTSSQRSGIYDYTDSGKYKTRLVISIDNGICIDTFYHNLDVASNFQIDYDIVELDCSYNVMFNSSSSYDDIEETTYSWEFGDGETSNDANVEYSYHEGGNYLVFLKIDSETGCSDSISFELSKEQLNEFSVPNVFTPNNDGINDELFVDGTIREMHWKIMDRWGRLVFETNDPYKGWDGTINNEAADEGVYYYSVTTNCNGFNDVSKVGTVTLLR